MYKLLQTDSPGPLVSLARPTTWNAPPRSVLSTGAVTARSEKPEIVEVSNGKSMPRDEAVRKKSVKAAVRRLRAIARGKPIGTVDEFIAARRAAAAEE